MAVNLKEYLKGILEPEELDLLVRSYDVVGDIAIIIIPEELDHRERVIGEAILANTKNIRVVARRDGLYSGEFRTIPLKIIAGEERKETEHKEYGVRLLVNPEKVYFSVRSGTERMRIASLVQPGERVLILFSGIAPYPLVIAKNSEAYEVVGIEKNPEAHRYGKMNLTRNKKLRNIRLIEGDALDILPTFKKRFDRIVMPLPKDGERFLESAIQALAENGWLHFYDMQQADDFASSVQKVERACDLCKRKLLSASVVKAGHCAPKTFRLCVDAQIG